MPGPVVGTCVAGCVAVLAARSAAWLPAWLGLHVSNVGLTLLGMLLLDHGRLRRGFTPRWLRRYAAGFAAGNVVVEAFDVGDLRWGVLEFRDVNTADPVDALFGLAGVAALLVVVARSARPVPDERSGTA